MKDDAKDWLDAQGFPQYVTHCLRDEEQLSGTKMLGWCVILVMVLIGIGVIVAGWMLV